MEKNNIKKTNFRQCRELTGLKQGQVAKLAGVSQASVCQLEQRGCFDTRTAVKYAKVLDCNPILLLDGLIND